MRVNWLSRYLQESVDRKICTRIYCTACGAMTFRTGVLRALAAETGQPIGSHYDVKQATTIARALAEVAPTPFEAQRFEAAVRCLVFELWHALGPWTLLPLVKGTWAGGVLDRMQAHYEARQAAEQARQQFEAAAPARRAEKQRAKQQRHQARLERKKERDRAWRATNAELG
jgi:hypothetical protein